MYQYVETIFDETWGNFLKKITKFCEHAIYLSTGNSIDTFMVVKGTQNKTEQQFILV